MSVVKHTLSPTTILYAGDCIETMRTLPDNSIDSVVCDPPYHLTSIVKRFGGPNAAPAQYGTDGAFARSSLGFMNAQWDGGDISFRPETWAEVLRVLKPGGYCAAFGAPRNFGRLQVAMFEAGFEERDTILNDVDPASPIAMFIGSLNDAQRDAFMKCFQQADIAGMLAWKFGVGFPKSHSMRDIGRPELGTNLKPAFEPIVLARKPLSEGTVAANVLRWGTGALNIDGCRVNSGPVEKHIRTANVTAANSMAGVSTGSTGSGEFVEGRWPANVVTDGSDEVIEAFPQSNGQLADASINPERRKTQNVYGAMKAGNGRVGEASANSDNEGIVGFKMKPGARRGDSGSAARFFYSAKASRKDRAGSKHPTVKPIALMEWLATLITPPGGTILDPFAGSGTTGAAARNKGFKVILCEREAEYVADIQRRFGSGQPDVAPMRLSGLARLLSWNAAVASYRSKQVAA